ncbi:MAG TPA: methylated-DNA--[protein]-cysteine S-methyltransferase [Thermoanaerobaculia bacterium]|nr:methylated-DNA--[protein]-cysteine S-methyltransferase [Thermoanaerobaculia bacterium]
MMMVIETPIGPLGAVLDEEGRLAELRFSRGTEMQNAECKMQNGKPDPLFHSAFCILHSAFPGTDASSLATELTEYFAGKRKMFTIPLAPRGTPFQLAVWNELLRIPYGSTISYAELARRIGKPSAVRAVGAANGANPIPVIIPCHRVIGANGTLTGYGGGLERKQWLLALEGERLF